MAKLFIRIGPCTCIPVTRSMKEPVIGVSISQRLGNEFNVGERRLKISDDRPDAILFILAGDEVRGHPAPHSGVIVQLTCTGKPGSQGNALVPPFRSLLFILICTHEKAPVQRDQAARKTLSAGQSTSHKTLATWKSHFFQLN